MHIETYVEKDSYPIAIFVKKAAFNKANLERYYVNYLVSNGINKEDIILCSLDYKDNDKAPATFVRDYFKKILPSIKALGIKYIYIADGNYIKPLFKVKKVAPIYGYQLPIQIDGYENIKGIPGVPYGGIPKNPSIRTSLNLTLDALVSTVDATYEEPGASILRVAERPKGHEVKDYLDSLLRYPMIAVDTETYGLNPYIAGIGTIAFAHNVYEGGAFPCDASETPLSGRSAHIRSPSHYVRSLLKDFFENYKGTLVFHNAIFDIKILVANLWMKDSTDKENQLHGLNVLTKNFHCTQIITYLATNNTVNNSLSLKHNAQEFAGNWAEDDIKDISRIPLDRLLDYNQVDCQATLYVFDKYYKVLQQDNQEDIYNNLFKPCVKLIANMELNGLPIDLDNVLLAERELRTTSDMCRKQIQESSLVKDFTKKIQYTTYLKENIKLKVKHKPLESFSDITFNPNSNKQLQDLLYTEAQLPVFSTTNKGAPSTDSDTLEALSNYLEAIPEKFEEKEFVDTLILYNKTQKILDSFIPAFRRYSRYDENRRCFLYGNFNITGTKSGRLSSSEPNLQNLPATGTVYAKLVKRCFKAPPGWVMMGADFDSLEDKISALTTKDSQKLKVYLDGYDGHSLRAYSYFGDRMHDIDPTSVESINSIADKYPKERQDSKGPTFALTYDGTWIALKQQCGLTEEQAKDIEQKYHELYKESDAWKEAKIQEACKKGYVKVAFGLRLRTPLLARTDLNKSYTPYEAQKEARTAGNALGQSYCLLNNRAALEFMDRVEASPYKYDIRLCCLIHDAIYLMVKDNIDVVHWVNQNLPECMAWQDLPEIQHDKVKLSGSCEIYYPDWSKVIPLPIGATKQEIQTICKEATA
jgi:DNA polymerase-1